MKYGSVATTLELAGLDAKRTISGGAGELATAAVLHDFEACHPEVAVLHSLRLPDPKTHTDIDHVVVAGRRVWLIDSKCWKPGTLDFWPAPLSQPHAGASRQQADDGLGAKAIQAYLGRTAPVETPLIVVCPSSRARTTRLGLWRPAGARSMTGQRFAARVRRIVKQAPADPGLVAALARLS